MTSNCFQWIRWRTSIQYASYAKQKQRASSETSIVYNGCTQATNEVSFKDSKKYNLKLWVDKYGKYNGIKIFIDERNATLSLPFDLTKYNDYVYRGGVLSKEELEE